MMRLMALGMLALALSGCAGTAGLCPPGGRETLVAELLFGRNIGDKVGVGEAAFRRYVDEELTPRFPDGLTVFDAAGQYRSGDHIVKEPSKVVLIALSEAPESKAKLDEAREAYKRRFRQESVGLILKRSCVSF